MVKRRHWRVVFQWPLMAFCFVLSNFAKVLATSHANVKDVTLAKQLLQRVSTSDELTMLSLLRKRSGSMQPESLGGSHGLHHADLEYMTLGKPKHLLTQSITKYNPNILLVPKVTPFIHEVKFGEKQHHSNHKILRKDHNNVATQAVEEKRSAVVMEVSAAPIPKSEEVAASEVAALAASRFLPFNASYPGLRVVHADPPIVVVEGFMSQEFCAKLKNTAEASGILARSETARTIGYTATASSSRTSHSLCMSDNTQDQDRETLTDEKAQALVREFREQAKALFPGCQWAGPRQLPPPKMLNWEKLQVTRYERGQYFRTHEDAFSLADAARNRVQRCATLLLYLNDVSEGGNTHFEELGMSIRPTVGSVLLFFPAYADGTPEPRTRHSAEIAIDTKWIAQQWIDIGVQPSNSFKILSETASQNVKNVWRFIRREIL